MRHLLPQHFLKSVPRIAMVAAAALVASTAAISAKIVKPDVSERTDDRIRAAAPAPATATTTAQVSQTPAGMVSSTQPTDPAPANPPRPQMTAAKPAAVDPNQAEPPSERALAAAERAKRALADEGSEDYSNTAPMQPVGQPVAQSVAQRTAARPPKPDQKCLAGC